MGYAPAALDELLQRYRAERHTLGNAADGADRVCSEFIEPLLTLLGWDVHNRQGAELGHAQVEALRLPVEGSDHPLRAYILHEQAFHYYRHHLLGVCAPPLQRQAGHLLAELDHTLSRSDILFETMALTDFGSISIYNNTPADPHSTMARRARLYTLPCWQYAAWWNSLGYPAKLLLNRRLFDLYAKKLRLWGGLHTREDETAAEG